VANPRNRVRHRILPELELAAGGATQPAIARAAAVIRDDAQWLDQLADERFRLAVPGPSPGAPPGASGRLWWSRSRVGACGDGDSAPAWRSGRGGPAGEPRGAARPETGLAPAEGWPKVILLRSMLGGEGS
jgi:hypothetical protein